MNRSGMRRPLAALAGLALGVTLVPMTAVGSAAATPTELFFSEYIEGSSFNKAVEIYNGTGRAVNLTGYTLRLYSNGAANPSQSVNLTGTLPADDVFVVAHGSAAADLKAEADLISNAVANWNGDDAVALAKDGQLVDVIGQIGFDPGSEWGTGAESTADNTLRRKESVVAGDSNGSDSFDPALEWDGFPNNTIDGFGWHLDAPPSVDSSFPWDGRINVASGQTLSLTFNEPVTLAADAISLTCDGSEVPVTVAGAGAEYTVDPAGDLAAEAVCTWTVAAEGVTDLDRKIQPMRDDFVVEFTVAQAGEPCSWDTTPTYEIQGSDSRTNLSDDLNTTGVVVGDYEHENGLRGFYIQDVEGDGDAGTSDGLFVFNGNDDDVSVGDVVVVGGTPSEFQGQTQVSAYRDGVTVCGTGSVAATDVALPMTDAERETFEGMLVRLPQELAVTETYQLGRFGQVTVSAPHEMTPPSLGGRLPQPTNIVEPGPESSEVQELNDLNRIIFDDALQSQNPDPIRFARDEGGLSAANTLRGGDTATGTVGVMTYTWAGNGASGNAYRVRPLGALGGHVDFVAKNQRPAGPEDVGGDLTASSFNVLNYFNTFEDFDTDAGECRGGVAGEPMECRGANNVFEQERQADKIVAALAGLDADVVGLIEIENDGYGADSAIADLVRRLNDVVGADTYRYLDVDERTGQVDALGDDAIKVGLIYKHREVVPNGETAVLNTESFVNGGTSSPKNRPALAQAFLDRDTGGRFTMVVNHLKSKGSGCGSGNDDPQQGSCNVTRVRAAQELADWLATYPTGIKEPDVLLMGDLNSYAKEDPIDALLAAGFTNLVEKFEGQGAYSYVFDGQWGYLDHALASETLLEQVTGTTTWHINADEPPVLDYNTDFKSQEQVEGLYAPTPYRSSDHDPVLVGLELTP